MLQQVSSPKNTQFSPLTIKGQRCRGVSSWCRSCTHLSAMSSKWAGPSFLLASVVAHAWPAKSVGHTGSPGIVPSCLCLVLAPSGWKMALAQHCPSLTTAAHVTNFVSERQKYLLCYSSVIKQLLSNNKGNTDKPNWFLDIFICVSQSPIYIPAYQLGNLITTAPSAIH